MTAEEAAEILRGTCVPVSVDAETQEHRSYEVTPADIAAMVTARERAARVEALRDLMGRTETDLAAIPSKYDRNKVWHWLAARAEEDRT